MRWRRVVSWVLVGAAVLAAGAAVVADTVRTKDGRSIVGVVDVLGDKVRVTREDGSTLVLDKSEVEEIIRQKTKLQEYADREAAVKPTDAAGRFNLALWCDRNDLPTEAVRECAKALAIQPGHQGARELMLQLLQAASAAAEARSASAKPGPERTVGRDNLLLEEEPMTQRFFREVVQPVLNSACASAQCHGGEGGGRLRLKRMRIGGLATPEVFLPNFDAIYPYITDFDNPERCPLIQHPLAIEAGGIPSQCRKVFASKSDPRAVVLARLVRSLSYPAGYKKREEGARPPG